MGAEPEEPTFLEKVKFYTSLCMGTTAIVAVFAFLFLIPFVVDPAISTIISDYDPVAVACVTVEYNYGEGLKNCTWSSCREGCTTAPVKCPQVLVNYSSKMSFEESNRTSAWKTDPDFWTVNYTRFFVNTEGCGYPPRVNCTHFAGNYSKLGKVYPCYYSRTYPGKVVAVYNWNENLRNLIVALIAPPVLFGLSIGILSYWYCPSCNRGCKKYEETYPSKEE